MVGQDILCIIKPEAGHLREDRSFFGDLVFQDHVECRDPVCCHHDQGIADIVNLADFTFFDGRIGLHRYFLLPAVLFSSTKVYVSHREKKNKNRLAGFRTFGNGGFQTAIMLY